MPQVDESDDGREVELPVGRALEIRLRENPTTGFRWSLESDGAPACVLVDDSYQRATDTPGSEGTHHWRFRAARPGEGLVELRYRRTWERQGAAARSFTPHVRITP